MWARATASAETGWAAAPTEELDEAVGRLGVARRAAQREPALGPRRRHGDRPARADLAEHLVLGHLHLVEEDLGESGLAVDLGDGPHRDAGRVHGDEKVGQAAMALRFGVGAEDPEAPVGERAAAGPRLLAVEHPAVPGRVARGVRADAGEVAAGVGLGPALAPDFVRAGHGREEARLLRLGPVLEQGGAEEEDAVLAHPLGGAGAVVLLLEDEPLEDPEVAPAVLGGPAHHRPAVLVQGVLPGAMSLEAAGRVEGGQRLGRDVLGQPGPRLGPEGLVLGEKRQVHGGSESGTAPWVAPAVWRTRPRRGHN